MKTDLKKFKKNWFLRNPVHDNNADTGEDMFWGTAELLAREYTNIEKLEAGYERMKKALKKIRASKDCEYEIWEIINKALKGE
ncbi:hypothetical protein LCGC14_2845760 [marine sediment metagenome]|uniref:Uncharacterized protein n=1 Tax=marine sediment metagenome TaxID=412755 RepID=A0A0F9AI77_9ZZZZ